MIDYFNSAECAKRWGVSQRRVMMYCKDGRIEGAVLISNRWLIPKNAEKPTDPRRGRK